MDGGDACGTYVTNGRGNSREIFVVRGKFETVDEGPCVVDEEVESIREELHVVIRQYRRLELDLKEVTQA